MGDGLSPSGIGCGSLAFYGDFIRSSQYVVVSNRAFAHKQQQVTPGSVFHGLLVQWRGIQHYVYRVTHLNRHVIAGGLRAPDFLSSLMNLDLSDRAYLPLRSGLAKSRECRHKNAKDTNQPQHDCSFRMLYRISLSLRARSFAGVCYWG